MIEKPKRPKKPDIQDRQPPRKLQELINRYDLDNTKIYDFLDELVNQLNADRETIDSDINGKVNKSGDTMTGELNMQSNPIRFGNGGNIYFKEDGYGDKFRIIPDFGNIGANNKLIIQSTTGEAGTDPQNWKDLVYIRADSGEIDLIGDVISPKQFKQNGTINTGESYISNYIQNFFGFIIVRVWASNYECFKNISVFAPNKYAQKEEILSQFEYQGDANKKCTIDFFDSPDTPNIHLRITNTGNELLNYDIVFLNKL